MKEELEQLHNKKVFTPINTESLTREQKHQAIGSLMFLKEKRDGRIKGRVCANGSTQRSLSAKEDAASPTVSLEAVLMSCIIDATENRVVATTDIPGAYLHANMDDFVVMKMQGTLAELMVRADRSIYGKYLTTDTKGRSVMYLVLKKSLYGCLRSSIESSRKISKTMDLS